MSITKFENVEGELISQADIDSQKVSARTSRCSCSECDPINCIEKRKKAVEDRCQCGICRELRAKLSINNKVYQGDKGDLESATKKIVREVVTRETIESLKRVTETMYEYGNNENFRVIRKKQSKPSDMKVIPSPTVSQISLRIECSKQRSTGNNRINSESGCCKPKPIIQIPSTDKEVHKENYTATKLSAQVMNVPYEELHETRPSTHELSEQSPLSKLNIFRRIKEIYDACSCKVCECISSKPRETREEICKCKPCQCQDCVKLRKKIEEKIKRIPHSGCPCIRCDRKDCRGIAKNAYESQPCDCSPSEGVQYPEFNKRCKCEPCQCINCRLSGLRTAKTVKLGQIDAYIQRESCLCSPCECIECKNIYNRTNPTIMCTHGSDVNKYGNFCRCHNCTERCQFGLNEICKCDIQNIPLRKSFDKNYNDYDIRTVIVDNNGPFDQQKERNLTCAKHNTVALYASLKNSYPSNSCSRGACKCTECECIVCNAKDDSLRNYRDNLKHNVMSLHNDMKLSTSIMNACKCTPCECEICSKKGEAEDSIKLFERKCRCDVCDCLNCDNASVATSSFPSSSRQSYSNHGYSRQSTKPIRCIDMNKNCNCNPCECRNCKKLFSCSSSVKFYSGGKSVERKTRRSRKVMLITPVTSGANLKARKKCLQSVSSTTLSPKPSSEGVFRQDISTCHAVSQNYVPGSNLPLTNRNEVCQLYQDSKDYYDICDEDVDREMFFDLNNPVLDAASMKSVDETPSLNYPCNFNQSFKSHKIVNPDEVKPSEEKYKHFFNIIHEQPDKIISNDSEESLPVYWTCCDGTSYPRSNPRSIMINCEKPRSKLKYDLSNRLNKAQCSKNKNDSNSDAHRSYDYDDKCFNLPAESQKYTDLFSTSIPDDNNNQECGKIKLNNSEVSIDYERATRVLGEAKAFSSKLIKMLDSFETANRQFESASQKFKVLHESLLNINESELNKTYSANLATTSRSTYENTFEIISEVTHDSNKSTNDSVKNENEAEREYEQSTTKTKDVCDNFELPEESSKDMELQENNPTNAVNNSNIKQKLQSNIEESNKSLQDGSDTTNLNSNEVNFNDDSKNKMENDNTENIIEKPTIESVMKKLDSVFANITITDTSVATDDVKQNLIESAKQQEKQTWQIFKKNLFLNPYQKQKRTIFQSSALELDIKEAIQAISLQTTNESYPKVISKPNEALANLQTEVNDLLNMPLLQRNSKFKCKAEPEHLLPRTKFNLEAKSFSSTASSQTYDRIIKKADKEVYFNINSEKSKTCCDQLKANFTGLRRVSDHTVLVKWKVPERIADVQGYELLVDGRAVQKIFSPTRSMAVVTCLPPAARVLLTVRTIAADGCGHAPASTIVYRPRMK